MVRKKPTMIKKKNKQVHFDMELDTYIDFEKLVYSRGFTVSEYLRIKILEVIENEI